MLLAALVAAWLPSTAAEAATTSRLAGSDRYATAAKVSAATFASGVPVAYVATGTAFPDALAGGAAAAHQGGPVLLTAATALPSATRDELTRLAPGRIVVLGGESTVGASVAAELAEHTTGSVTRISGANRYETAAKVSAATFAPGVSSVHLTTGTGYADALAAGPAAARGGGPVLLTAPDALPAATLAELVRLRPASIVVMGGAPAVWPQVEEALRAYAPKVSRVFGPDRYATSAAAARRAFPSGAKSVHLATGAGFADALAGGPAAALSGGPLMLVSKECVPASVADEITRLNPESVHVLGDEGVVSAAAAALTRCGGSNPLPKGALSGGPAKSIVLEAPDHASDAFGDPWDYSNREDEHVGTPQMSNGGSIAGGLLTYTTATPYPWMDPIPYLPGSMPLERDGPSAPVDTSKYTHVSFRMNASEAGPGILVWSTCDWSVNPGCQGATGVAVSAGWKTYDVKLTPTDKNLTAPWSGKGLRLRFIPTNQTGTVVKVDWMRLHGAAAPVPFELTPAAPGAVNEVYWDSDADPTNNTAENPGWGLLTSTSSTSVSFPVATYPPGTYRLYTRASGRTGPYTEPLQVLPRTRAVVESPSTAGGADYASTVRKNPWDFSGLDDVGRNLHMCNKRILPGGVLAANNCGSEIDNPFFFLPNPTPIDGNTWHRLTLRLRYDGEFGLNGGPVGGSVARLIWYVASDSGRSDQNVHDIVVYPGWQTITVDLKTDPSWAVTDETQKAQRIGWAGQSITSLRLDPNEDVSSRNWYVDSVKLTRVDAGKGRFDLRYRETSGSAGGSAEVFLDRDNVPGGGVSVARSNVVGGTRTVPFALPASLPTGRYWPYVVVRGPGGSVTRYANAPVDLSR